MAIALLFLSIHSDTSSPVVTRRCDTVAAAAECTETHDGTNKVDRKRIVRLVLDRQSVFRCLYTKEGVPLSPAIEYSYSVQINGYSLH